MSTTRANSIFSTLYRTRITAGKGSTSIANLSLIFCVIAALTAPWLVVGSIIAALALGYKISVVRNAADFSGDFDEVVNEARDNVRSAVDSFTGKGA